MKYRSSLSVPGLLGLLLPALATAQINMVIFDGTVETVGAGVSSEFTAGESISGYFFYDTTTAPHSISSADQAWYDAISLDFRIGDYNGADSTIAAPSEAIYVVNDVSGRDTFGIGTNPDGAPVAGLAPENFRFQLNDPTATVFADASMPVLLDLADFDTANTNLSYITLTFGTGPGTSNQVRGRIDRLTVAPPRLMVLFDGSVVSVGSGVSGAFSLGDEVSGKFTYDPTTVAHAISSANEAWYDAIRLRYRFGTYRGADPTPLAASDGLRVANNFGGSDTFSVGTHSPLGPPVAGLAPDHFRFQLNDPGASVFVDATPPTALDLTNFDAANTNLTYAALTFGTAPGTANQVRAQVTAVTLLPVGDEDLDGVFDDIDNCVDVVNPGQVDTDGDGIGNRCDADLNNDCTINFADLGIMRSVFFTSDPHADLDVNGIVDFRDLWMLRSTFFGTPGPSCAPNICE